MKKFGLILIAACLLLSACGKKTGVRTIYIAEQFGTAYAPVALMRERGILQNNLPEGTQIKWVQLGNTAAIREAMLAGEADVGFMAIPPFLIGKDAGMDWRICSGLSDVPMGLVTRDPDIHDLSDIGDARIALPQPGSIQHILLAMAAQKQLGSHDIFDDRLVSMAHPDGMSALLSGSEISLHFTTSPYLTQELEAGMRQILSAEDAMGEPFTGIVAVARNGFINEEKELYEAFIKSLHEAIGQIKGDPSSAAKTLAPVYNMGESELLRELTADGADFSQGVKGLERFVDFLYEAGYIKQKYAEDELLIPGVSTQ